jgi:hypothetical protein
VKSSLLTLAGALALLAVLGKFYAVPALAQAARAALVQDRDNPARAAFSTLVPIDPTAGAASPAVPTGQRTITTSIEFHALTAPNLNCGVEVIAPGQHAFYNLNPIPGFLTTSEANLKPATEQYSGTFPFQIALDPGQNIQTNLACEDNSGGIQKFSTAEAAFSGYTISIP